MLHFRRALLESSHAFSPDDIVVLRAIYDAAAQNLGLQEPQDRLALAELVIKLVAALPTATVDDLTQDAVIGYQSESNKH